MIPRKISWDSFQYRNQWQQPVINQNAYGIINHHRNFEGWLPNFIVITVGALPPLGSKLSTRTIVITFDLIYIRNLNRKMKIGLHTYRSPWIVCRNASHETHWEQYCNYLTGALLFGRDRQSNPFDDLTQIKSVINRHVIFRKLLQYGN